ncbi:hypothetical protein C8A00DRAFT_17063 [Chaetomidium leptoderma]|uniref:RRM domain-containing protein n=1 Tax=Chaetomidium leptoderma TaxID=669021 RepID=A0AAN6ZTP7_9PEZI|nr:hypothetical protein C8A00DRAFT_17063 [Chaetomidium leptoderma]
MATTVYVKNIGAQTQDKEIKDFFSFCGKISNINIDVSSEADAPKSATVTFEKETAARTALLLNHTQLGGNEISVTGDNISTPPDESTTTGSGADATQTAERDPLLSQEEKPRSRILAEVLAHGYMVADQGLQKAISLDEQHGISSRFVSTLKQLDEKTHATDHARAADASYGITQRASSLLTGLSSYFEKASNTPTGKRIVEFYTTSQRQVQDIHTEARRLAELKKEEGGGGAGSLYKNLGLDKVLGRFQSGGSTEEGAAAGGSEKKEVPGGAPADAVATESAQKPAAPSGNGGPETIH